MPARYPPPLKRLSRPDAPLRAFRATPRIVALLAAVARARVLTSDQLARLDGGSHQKVLRHLQLCFQSGLLDRPVSQHALLARFFDQGNRPLAYALSKKGARLLAELGVPIDAELDWVAKNKRVGVPFLAHTIAVAEAIIQFALACRAAAGPRLIDHHDLLPLMPEATRLLRDPFCLHVMHRTHDYKDMPLSIVPDRVFSLVNADNTRTNYALELDRGTMDVGHKTKHTKLAGKVTFRKKQLGYFEAWTQGAHQTQWGFRSFRVLTLCPSDKRITNMLVAQRKVTSASAHGLFLYSTADRLREHGVFGSAWITSKDEGVSLLDRK